MSKCVFRFVVCSIKSDTISTTTNADITEVTMATYGVKNHPLCKSKYEKLKLFYPEFLTIHSTNVRFASLLEHCCMYSSLSMTPHHITMATRKSLIATSNHDNTTVCLPIQYKSHFNSYNYGRAIEN